jgi:pimeloyl-ACP methyl ester carboxylesterase
MDFHIFSESENLPLKLKSKPYYLDLNLLKILSYISLILYSLTFSACFRAALSPDLGELYNKSIQQSAPTRNPVIVIPGVLGSNLVDSATGKSIWGAWDGEFANPKIDKEARLIALPLDPSLDPFRLEDSVTNAGALERIRLRVFGFPVGFKAYAQLLVTLGAGGYIDQTMASSQGNSIDYGDEHFTCFQFDYDWRKSNAANAAKLDSFIKEKKKYIENEYRRRYKIEPKEIKFDIVAHSMGGLLSRYYLRYGNQPLNLEGPLPVLNWAGAKHVDKLITVGTPNLGSLHSFQSLLEGRKDSIFLPFYSPVLMGSFPSLYELLPRNSDSPVSLKGKERQIDLFESQVWDQYNWGLLSSDKHLKVLLPSIQTPDERRNTAKEHLSRLLKHAKRFHQTLDLKAQPPEGLSIYLFTGDANPTAEKGKVNRYGELSFTLHSPGDGIVTRKSALADKRNENSDQPKLVSPIDWTGVYFIFEDHLGLIEDNTFSDNLLYLLLERPAFNGPVL